MRYGAGLRLGKRGSMHDVTRPLHSIAARSLGVIVLISAIAPARAEGPQVAQVKTVSGPVVVVRGGTRLPAKTGDALFEKDTIETGADGSVGITFIDNSVMSAGPDSEIGLEEYRFDSSNFNGAMLADMHKGTLSMVSGDIARSSPGAMKVKTPKAILGVRGTRFVIQVRGD
jgi:hypothetical protein